MSSWKVSLIKDTACMLCDVCYLVASGKGMSLSQESKLVQDDDAVRCRIFGACILIKRPNVGVLFSAFADWMLTALQLMF